MKMFKTILFGFITFYFLFIPCMGEDIHKAAMEAKFANGDTPLANALRRGHEDIVTLLMANKAKGITDLKMESQKIVLDQIDQKGMDTPLKFTILYDNYLHEQGTKPDWGFSCLIEGTEKVILFDTGTQPDILLHNVDHLGIDLKKVEQIVISHDHYDHIGVEKCGATHCTGDRPIELFKKAFGDNYVPMGTGKILEIKQ